MPLFVAVHIAFTFLWEYFLSFLFLNYLVTGCFLKFAFSCFFKFIFSFKKFPPTLLSVGCFFFFFHRKMEWLSSFNIEDWSFLKNLNSRHFSFRVQLEKQSFWIVNSIYETSVNCVCVYGLKMTQRLWSPSKVAFMEHS